MKKIILTGGGTAGHVTPNIALLPALKKEGYEISYIGRKTGIEKELIENCNIPYYGISSGKLRRYLDIKNFTDGFRVVKGIADAVKIIKKVKPDIVFSKGGFITVPVVLAARFCNVPVVIHESDLTPGLANKISIPFAKKICVSFPETATFIRNGKAVQTGTPIRQELFEGEKRKGYKLCDFTDTLPVILVIGGSQGSVKINTCLRAALPKLLKHFQVVHVCGKGNLEKSINLVGYKQFEYLSEELTHIFAIADIIVSRAGANSIYEFLSLKKPSLLIPLSKNASRGDQILNAESFRRQGFSAVLEEENLAEDSLLLKINDLYENRESYKKNMELSKSSYGVEEVMKVINGY